MENGDNITENRVCTWRYIHNNSESIKNVSSQYFINYLGKKQFVGILSSQTWPIGETSRATIGQNLVEQVEFTYCFCKSDFKDEK